jgi:hypothetical protein
VHAECFRGWRRHMHGRKNRERAVGSLLKHFHKVCALVKDARSVSRPQVQGSRSPPLRERSILATVWRKLAPGKLLGYT